jgi:hypothetical protein
VNLLEKLPGGDMKSLPNLCLSISIAYLKLDDLQTAYLYTQKALYYMKRMPSHYSRKELVISQMTSILQKAAEAHQDLDADGEPDPGSISIPVWIAKFLIKNEARDWATEYLRTAHRHNPLNREASSLLSLLENENSKN